MTSPDKARYVQTMFGRISRRYDLMNRLMTFGQDQHWRKFAVRQAWVPAFGRVLDLATGTGDLALAVLDVRPSATVVGVDFALPMMQIGQLKLNNRPSRRIDFAGGDALQLPFDDDTFDTCLSAFMMRNVADVARAFREQRRVVRPGARVVCLEITQPATPLFRELFNIYFGRFVPAVGGIVSEGDAYTYLPASVQAFLTPPELARVMREAGLRDVVYYPLALGAVSVHVGTKTSEQ
ncbi:MAG: Demethylmenaquinone methyltransferase [Anaerolineales bacterium]|nr:Demethylmenaquinone methyltransferase [Anaerolineales bacterium]